MQPNACSIQKLKKDMAARNEKEYEKESGNTRKRNELPPEILYIIVPALKAGGFAGMVNELPLST